MPATKKKSGPKRSLPGFLEQRGQSFRWTVSINGSLHRETFATDGDRDEAERLVRKEFDKLSREAERVAVGLPGPSRFSALAKRFEDEVLPLKAAGTIKTYTDSLTAFDLYFTKKLRDPKVSEIRQGHVRGFLTWRRTHPLRGKGEVSSRTVAKDRAVLHALFAFAEEMELREGNPVTKVRPPKSDPREPVILSDEQFEALLEQCTDPMLKMYVLMLGETGGRAYSEALRLAWTDVDLEAGFLWIATGREGHRTKSGKGRWVPMTARLTAAMRDHMAAFRLKNKSPWVFHHVRNRRRAKKGQRLTSLHRGFRSAALRAKLPANLHQHDLRHRRITTWLAGGGDVVKVKEAVGHSDLRTTMGYTHLVRENLRSLVQHEDARKVGKGA